MKKILFYLMGACGLAAACTETTEGFLDSKGKEADDLDAIFSDSAKTMGANSALYFDIGRLTMSPHNNSSNLNEYKCYEACTDNSRHTYFTLSEYTPAFTKGNFSQGGTNANFTDFRRAWQEEYQTIYRCNVFLQNYQRSPLSQAMKDKLANEARFVRAFFYYHLIRCFGSVPIIGDQVIDPFDPVYLARPTLEDCINYVADELRACAEVLPLVADGIDYGRPTKAAALGVLTELYAWAASPLFNGGNIGSGDNRLLVGYDNYDVNRWKKVVSTAEELMALGTNELVIDNDTRPGNGFYKATTTRVSKERVWFWITINYTFPQKQLLPASRGGAHRIFPYHELVEAFPMKDGTPIDKSSVEYNSNPYANRDPRLDFTILHNESEWIETVNSSTKKKIYTYRGASDDGYGVGSGSPTGYYFRKCCNENKLGGTYDAEGQGLSFIRYADIMLLYAEALTELDVNANRATIEDQLFQIRNRAGIDPGDNGRYGVPEDMSKDEMIDFIMNERRIEFANECGNRFWDLKRRKMFEKLDGVWTSAAVWEKAADGSYTWSVIPIEQHFFSQRMYFNAIPQREINSSHGMLIQNPGW